MPRKRKSAPKPKQEKKKPAKKPDQETMTPGKAMDTLIRKIDAINQSRGINHGFAPPMFASLALASRCTGKPADPVDLSKYLTDNGPDDGACQSQTSLFRSTERNSIGCHRNGCAYATGSAWLPSVLGEYCTSCDTFLTEANGGGKATALVRFFWYSSISVNGHSDTTPCVAQEDLVDLAFALLVSRGEEKAIRYCLDFDENQYDAVITNKAFREGVAELRGEYSRYKKAAALVALAAIVGAAVYIHKRDERGLRGAWADVNTKLSGLYTSTVLTVPTVESQPKKKRKTPKRPTGPSFDQVRTEWESDIMAAKAEAAGAARRKAVAAEAAMRKASGAKLIEWESDIMATKAEAAGAARRKAVAAEAAMRKASGVKLIEWESDIMAAKAAKAGAVAAAKRKADAAEAAMRKASGVKLIEWESDIMAAKAAKAGAVAAAKRKADAAEADRREASEAKITEWESDYMATKARKTTAESRRQIMTARREQKLDDNAASERRRRRESAKDSINPAEQEHARKRRASAPPPPQTITSYEVGTRAEAANAKKVFDQALQKNREEHWSEETWLDWIDRNTRKLGFDAKKYMSPKEKAALRKSRRDLENSVKDRVAAVQAGLLDVRDTFTSGEVAAMFQPWKQSEFVRDDNILRTRSRTLRGSDRPEVALSNWQS